MAENPNGNFVRKRRVQQFKKPFELLGVSGLRILELLGAGNTATTVASMIPCRKSNVTYWSKKLVSIGALKLQTKDVFKLYSLTPYGSTLLTRSEGGLGEVVVLEDCAVKFVVLEGERGVLDWVKLGEPRNWVKLGVRVGCVRVEKTSRHIIIHPGRLKGFDVDLLEVEAGRIVERVHSVLESRFGMVLSEEGVPLHKPIYRFYSEEAREDVKNGTCIVEGVGSIDNSSPEHVPHEEFNGKQRARARLLLPDSVRCLELKIDDLRGVILGLVAALKPIEQLTGALERLFPPEPLLSPNQDTMDKYVI